MVQDFALFTKKTANLLMSTAPFAGLNKLKQLIHSKTLSRHKKQKQKQNKSMPKRLLFCVLFCAYPENNQNQRSF
jgi:hypothetical protein